MTYETYENYINSAGQSSYTHKLISTHKNHNNVSDDKDHSLIAETRTEIIASNVWGTTRLCSQ